jgi:hypothetical protein
MLKVGSRGEYAYLAPVTSEYELITAMFVNVPRKLLQVLIHIALYAQLIRSGPSELPFCGKPVSKPPTMLTSSIGLVLRSPRQASLPQVASSATKSVL